MSDKPNSDPPRKAHNANQLGGEIPAWYASAADLSTHEGKDNPHATSAELTAPGGVLQSAQVPNLAITKTYTVADQTERLALDVQEGDVAIQNDNDTTYMFTGGDPSLNTNWSVFVFDVPVDTVLGRTGDVTAQSGDYSHSQIANVGTDDHHSRYTDSEASAAAPVQESKTETLTAGSGAGSYTLADTWKPDPLMIQLDVTTNDNPVGEPLLCHVKSYNTDGSGNVTGFDYVIYNDQTSADRDFNVRIMGTRV